MVRASAAPRWRAFSSPCYVHSDQVSAQLGALGERAQALSDRVGAVEGQMAEGRSDIFNATKTVADARIRIDELAQV